jgi:hypothetical protein
VIPALIVGVLTAWYLGLRAGLIAAGLSFLAVLVAGFIPGASITVYALILGWCALLYFFGKHLAVKKVKHAVSGASAASTVNQWIGRARRLFGGGHK